MIFSFSATPDFDFMTYPIPRASFHRLSRHPAVDMNDSLSHFYMQIKMQELLYLLFRKLSTRESAPHQNINSVDAERLLYQEARKGKIVGKTVIMVG